MLANATPDLAPSGRDSARRVAPGAARLRPADATGNAKGRKEGIPAFGHRTGQHGSDRRRNSRRYSGGEPGKARSSSPQPTTARQASSATDSATTGARRIAIRPVSGAVRGTALESMVVSNAITAHKPGRSTQNTETVERRAARHAATRRPAGRCRRRHAARTRSRHTHERRAARGVTPQSGLRWDRQTMSQRHVTGRH